MSKDTTVHLEKRKKQSETEEEESGKEDTRIGRKIPTISFFLIELELSKLSSKELEEE